MGFEGELMFKYQKETTWLSIVAAILIVSLMATDFLDPIAHTLTKATAGLIQYPLVYNLSFFVIVFVGLVKFTKMRWSDFGFARNQLIPAILLSFGVWVLANIAVLVVSLVQGSTISPAEFWQKDGFLAILGKTIGFIFGVGLLEETFFRGFLLPQLYFKFGGSREKRQWLKLISAFVISLVAFTLPHFLVTSSIGMNSVVGTMIGVFILGGILTTFYLRTNNLVLAIIFHGLLDYALPIFETVEVAEGAGVSIYELIMLGLWILVLVIWPYLPQYLNQGPDVLKIPAHNLSHSGTIEKSMKL